MSDIYEKDAAFEPRPMRVVRIRFPCEIRVEGNDVLVELPKMVGPFFAQDAIERLAPELSGKEQERLARDVVAFAETEMIRRSLLVE